MNFQRTACSFLCVVTVVLSAAVCSAHAPRGENSPELITLLKQRRDILQKLVAQLDQRYRNGSVTNEAVIRATNRLLDAELELATTRQQRLDILEKSVENLQALEEIAAAQVRTGQAPQDNVLAVQAERLAAQIRLQRERETKSQQ